MFSGARGLLSLGGLRVQFPGAQSLRLAVWKGARLAAWQGAKTDVGLDRDDRRTTVPLSWPEARCWPTLTLCVFAMIRGVQELLARPLYHRSLES